MIQDKPGSGIRDVFMRRLEAWRPDILAFPEYYFVGEEFSEVPHSLGQRDEIISQLQEWSASLGCIVVGGSLVENDSGALYNRCHLINKGETIGHYDKIHLFRTEGGGLVSPGTEHRVFEVDGLRIGLLICADVLYPESFVELRKLEPDLIFVPTTSPFKPNEPAEVKFARDIEIFARGAEAADAFIFKVNASGSIIGHPLQGRSLIASPGEILWRIEPENEDKPALILATLRDNKRNPSLDIEVHRP